MTRIQFIADQTQQTRALTLQLISDATEEQWYKTPNVINSNIAWQVGHLIISQYYHAIAVITAEKTKARALPLKEYATLYTKDGALSKSREELPPPKTLSDHLNSVEEIAREVLMNLNDDDLDQPLEPTRFPHPIARTKYEALTWSFRHEMWHGGQISMIKRVLGKPMRWM